MTANPDFMGMRLVAALQCVAGRPGEILKHMVMNAVVWSLSTETPVYKQYGYASSTVQSARRPNCCRTWSSSCRYVCPVRRTPQGPSLPRVSARCAYVSMTTHNSLRSSTRSFSVFTHNRTCLLLLPLSVFCYCCCCYCNYVSK